MEDHHYNLAILPGARGKGDSEAAGMEIDEQLSKAEKINQGHTPIKSPHPKKCKKGKENPHSDGIGETILMAVNSLTEKMDTQTELLLKFEKRKTGKLARSSGRWYGMLDLEGKELS